MFQVLHHSRKKSQALAYIMIFTTISLLLAGCSKNKVVVEEIPVVRSQVVKKGATGQSASYAGEVRGRYESQLAFQVSGRIIKRNIELGSIVNPGDVLMEIDTKDLAQGLNSRAAQVAVVESEVQLAENNLNRYDALFAQNVISRAELDRYKAAYDAATARLRQARAQYSDGMNQFDYSNLYANTAGVVASIDAEAGQVVGAGQKVMTLIQDNEKEVEINIPENRIEELRKNKNVSVKFWAMPDANIKGQVREIAPMADKITRTYKMRISLLNPPQALKLGMTATVLVNGDNGQVAVYVPLSAIYQTGDAPSIWVINDGAVSLKPVKLGVFGNDQVQVLEGLNDGDVIVTAGVHKLHEGQKVRKAEGDI